MEVDIIETEPTVTLTLTRSELLNLFNMVDLATDNYDEIEENSQILSDQIREAYDPLVTEGIFSEIYKASRQLTGRV